MSDDQRKELVFGKLYEHRSTKTGAQYFRGRLGSLRVALLSTGETADDGKPVWNLVLSEYLDGAEVAQRRVERYRARHEAANGPREDQR